MFHIIIILVTITVINIIIFPTLGFSFPSSPTRKDTKVNVDGKATVLITPPVISNNVTLTHYMQLPVEQYVLIPMPLGSSLTTRVRNDDDINDNNQKLSSNTEFELVVPTITFFQLSLTPVVYATVQPQENQVVISSNQCILRGSPFIEKVQLNDRFDFFVNTTLTWTDDTGLANNQNGDKDINTNSTECSITAETCIKVDVDVPRPFNTIPKRIIEKTGNAAMHISLRYIQASFVDNLAVDYNKWSTDEEYRKYRASLSEKVVIDDEKKEDEITPTEIEVHDAPKVSSRTNRNISQSRKSSRLKRVLSKFSRRRRHKRMQESSETCL